MKSMICAALCLLATPGAFAQGKYDLSPDGTVRVDNPCTDKWCSQAFLIGNYIKENLRSNKVEISKLYSAYAYDFFNGLSFEFFRNGDGRDVIFVEFLGRDVRSNEYITGRCHVPYPNDMSGLEFSDKTCSWWINGKESVMNVFGAKSFLSVPKLSFDKTPN